MPMVSTRVYPVDIYQHRDASKMDHSSKLSATGVVVYCHICPRIKVPNSCCTVIPGRSERDCFPFGLFERINGNWG